MQRVLQIVTAFQWEGVSRELGCHAPRTSTVNSLLVLQTLQRHFAAFSCRCTLPQSNFAKSLKDGILIFFLFGKLIDVQK